MDDYQNDEAPRDTSSPYATVRTPPQSSEAEQSVLGGLMLLSNRLAPAEVVETISDLALTENDFYRRDHRLIYRAIQTLAENGQPVDPVTLGEWFKTNGLSEQVGGAYLIELAASTPSAANIRAYAGIVRDKSVLRRLIEAGTEIVNFGFAPDGANASALFHRALTIVSTIEARVAPTEAPPVDLFADHQPPRLDPRWLPPQLAEFVVQCSAIKGSPPEVMALSSLVACAAAIDDRIQIQPRPNEPGWRESARLWGMVVGEPSTKKTPAMKLAMSGLSDMNVEMIAKNQRAVAEYDRAVAVARAKEKIATRAAAKGDGMPEDVEFPKAPKLERIITSDFTIEGIARLLVDNERGLLCYTDELAGWFGLMGKYSSNGGGNDRAAWLEFYQGGPKPIDRAGKTVLIPNASVSVIGAIQPDKIRALAKNMDDDGLLQRFIPIVLPREPVMPAEADEPRHLIRAYADLISHLWNTRPDGTLAVVTMSEEAITVRRELDEWRVTLSAADGLPPMLRSAVTKYEGLFPRLCLVYHALGCASLRKFPAQVPLQGATARRVADLIKRWIFPNALAFYTGVMGRASPGFDLARAVADYLLADAPARVTRRDITHGCGAWRQAEDWRQAAALSALEQAGWLVPENEGGPRGARAWTVNPRALREFSARAGAIQARRARAAEILAAAREAAR